jgi:hypothetical protein
MQPKTLYEVFWENGLEPELVFFIDGINWLYVIMLTIILYGFKHTELLDWFENLWGKYKKYTYWFASLITALIFIIFRSLEYGDLDVSYISSLLRSIVFTVIFSNIFVDIPVYIIKGLGKFIDNKKSD